MKPKVFRTTVFLIAILSIIVFACRHDTSFNSVKKDPLIEAEVWFHKTFDRSLRVDNLGKLTGGNKYPWWKFARQYEYRGLHIIETPIFFTHRAVPVIIDRQKGSITPSRNAAISKLLIGQDKNGRMKESVMTIIPHKDFYDRHPNLETISINSTPHDFKGVLLFYEWNGRFISGYKFNQGKIVSRIKPAPAARTAQDNCNDDWVYCEQVQFEEGCYDCEGTINTNGGDDIFDINCQYDDLNDGCGSPVYDTDPYNCTSGYVDPFGCPCINGVIDYNQCDLSGGGGGNGGDPYSEAEIEAMEQWDDSIYVDSDVPQCITAVLDTIRNMNRGTIAMIITKLSGQIPDFDWQLDTLNSLYWRSPNANATTDFYSNVGRSLTNLRMPRLTNATNVFYAGTLIHEAVHAFLFSWYNGNANLSQGFKDSMLNSSYGVQLQNYIEQSNIPQTNTVHHDIMVAFQLDIKDALVAYCNKMGITGGNIGDICEDLSWMGLQETNTYINDFTPAERESKETQWESCRTNTSQTGLAGTFYPLGSKACN